MLLADICQVFTRRILNIFVCVYYFSFDCLKKLKVNHLHFFIYLDYYLLLTNSQRCTYKKSWLLLMRLWFVRKIFMYVKISCMKILRSWSILNQKRFVFFVFKCMYVHIKPATPQASGNEKYLHRFINFFDHTILN